MHSISRRKFLAASMAAGAALSAGARFARAAERSLDFPLVDYHAHIDSVGSLEQLISLGADKHVKLGVVEHAGHKGQHYPGLISDDAALRAYIAKLEGKPVYKGIQAEWLDWAKSFSKDAIAQLDYALSDALTMPLKDGGEPVWLWTPMAQIEDSQEFMERYARFHVEIMRDEPIDILANVTFLPQSIAAGYDALWTPERMKKVIDAAVTYNVALEISSSYKLPKLPFLQMAKKAGVRFSFGSNIHGPGVGSLEYCIEMAKELGLKKKDMFVPAKPGHKPVEVRKFA